MFELVLDVEQWRRVCGQSMDEPLPLPYLERTGVRHEKHTESVKREGESGSGGGRSASGGSRRKIEVGEPLPLDYKGKTRERERAKVKMRVDLGEPLPLDSSLEESFEEKEGEKEKSVVVVGGGGVTTDEGRGRVVKQKSKVVYDFGPPLPLDYGILGEGRGNVTSHLSDESYVGREAQLAESGEAITSSPLDGTTLAEEVFDMAGTTEEVLRIAGKSDGDAVLAITALVEDKKHGGEYRLAALRAERVARRQVRVLDEVLHGGGCTGREAAKCAGVAGVAVLAVLAVLLVCVLAGVSYVLAD